MPDLTPDHILMLAHLQQDLRSFGAQLDFSIEVAKRKTYIEFNEIRYLSLVVELIPSHEFRADLLELLYLRLDTGSTDPAWSFMSWSRRKDSCRFNVQFHDEARRLSAGQFLAIRIHRLPRPDAPAQEALGETRSFWALLTEGGEIG